MTVVPPLTFVPLPNKVFAQVQFKGNTTKNRKKIVKSANVT